MRNMPDEPSLAEIIVDKTGIEPDQYLKGCQDRLKEDADLSQVILNNTNLRPVDLMQYFPVDTHYNKPLVNDLKLRNSRFLNQFGNIYTVPKIPQARMADGDDDIHSDPKLVRICDEFPYFMFGGVSFTCTHDYWWGPDPKSNAHAKDMFEIQYGIKLSDVYISLEELASTACMNSIFTEIDDFFVTGNYDNTVLTIWDNDLPYGAQGSCEKHACNFRPVFCVDQGVPVKYIKTVNDDGMFTREYVAEQRHKYAQQRTQTLKKLGEFYRCNNPNDYAVTGYPTDIDFIVKTGLCEFAFLCYDRSSQRGDFLITRVRYKTDGTDPKYTINKCDFRNLPRKIDDIHRARAMHFNKMYGSKGR